MHSASNSAKNSAAISGTGLYTPSDSISNQELVESFNQYVKLYNQEHAAQIEAGELAALQPSSTEFILKASGIQNRYVVDKKGVLDPRVMRPHIPERSNDEPSILCEMAINAANQALEAAGRTTADIDMVIVACSNLQRAYPAISIEVQSALGIQGSAFDMNVACSSATFGMQNALNAIKSGTAKGVLLINPEICSAHLNFRDRDSHFIFGDVCTASVIESTDTAKAGFEIIDTQLKTVFSNNIRNNFGFLNRCAPESAANKDKLFVQQGRKVFKEVCPMVAELITDQLAANKIPVTSVKRFWLHQANLSMNQLITKKILGRDATPDEAPTILNEYANTSSAGSVIAFHKNCQDFVKGEVGILSSFGAGYSAGSVILKRL